MWYYLTLLVALVALVAAALMGVLPYPPSAPAATLPLPPNVPDSAAEQTLERAAAAMAPDRLGCLETKLWHKVTLPDLTYEARGRYVLGPAQCFHLEMQAKQGETVSSQLVIGDGAFVWEATRVGGDAWEQVTKLDWKEVVAALGTTEKGEYLRWHFLEGRQFKGVEALLRNLQNRMNWVKIEKRQRGGQDRLRLVGVWKADYVKYVKGDQPWPACLPEQCRLEIDPVTLWPYRLEWWGPAAEGAADTLQVQLEFRDPVIHKSLTAEYCAKEFTFNPGDATIVDRTSQVKDEYKAKLAAK